MGPKLSFHCRNKTKTISGMLETQRSFNIQIEKIRMEVTSGFLLICAFEFRIHHHHQWLACLIKRETPLDSCPWFLSFRSSALSLCYRISYLCSLMFLILIKISDLDSWVQPPQVGNSECDNLQLLRSLTCFSGLTSFCAMLLLCKQRATAMFWVSPISQTIYK